MSKSTIPSGLRSLWIQPSWVWVLLGAAILLAPAIAYGRPFVFFDTPAYWGWGRDVLEALQRPWPGPGQAWTPSRTLHGWEIGAHGATPGDLRFTLTLLSARSAFYALPFYLLVSSAGLWSVAALQALIAAWVLRTAICAMAPTTTAVGYFAVVALLTAFSSVGFEAAYAMPDVFGGLALLAAGVLIAFPEKLSAAVRLGLVAVMAYATLAHAENGLDLIAGAALGALLYRSAEARWSAVLMRVAPVAAAVGAGLAVSIAGGLAMDAAFGRPLQMAPFLASRLLADGVAQTYLRQACPRAGLVACDLAQAPPTAPEYYLGDYPLDRPSASTPRRPQAIYDQVQFRAVTDAEAERREQFVAQQPRLLIGALVADGPGLAGAALVNGEASFINFGVNRDFDSVDRLLREHTQRRDQTAAITPGARRCGPDASTTCGRWDVGLLAPFQYASVLASLCLFVACLLRGSNAVKTEAGRFTALMVGLTFANAMLCGGLAGPYDRYQARVEWLIPFCALVLVFQWARLRQSAGRGSPVGPWSAVIGW